MKFMVFSRKIFALILLLFLILISPQTPTSADSNYFVVGVSQPDGTVCLGDTKIIAITWYPNESTGALTTLSGPEAIIAKAKRGTLSNYSIRPDSISGTSLIEYKADAEGHERIDVQVFSNSETGDATDKVEFEVKKCEYRFTFSGIIYDNIADGDTQISYKYSLLARGILKPSDLTNSRVVEGKDKLLRLQVAITSYSIPDCSYSTMEPANGFGFVDVKGYPGNGPKSMTIEISRPKDPFMDLGVTVYCDGEGSSVSAGVPIDFKDDPWLIHDFPAGQGSDSIAPTYFTETVDRVNGISGHNASYTATLTLERVETK